MRLVLDTDVIVAAMRSPSGASAELLRRIDRKRATIVLSVSLALEYEATCQLAEHRLAAGQNEADVTCYIDGLIALAEPVTPHFTWRPQLHDPGDGMVLEAAVSGQAQAIVTFNRRDYGLAPQRFGFDVLNPGDTLSRILK